jgi:hypothetical protein
MRFIALFLNLDNGDYNCVRNPTRDSSPRFYIFRGERIKDDYIKHKDIINKDMNGDAKEGMDDFFYSKNLYHFSRS